MFVDFFDDYFFSHKLIDDFKGQGFTPDEAELERLRHIETSLSKRTASRMTTSNGRISGGFTDSVQKFSSIGSSNTNNHIIESEFYRGLDTEKKQIKLNDEFDENEFGDKFIREARITREKELRLKFIDQQLEKIRNNNVTESNPSQSDKMSDFNSETVKIKFLKHNFLLKRKVNILILSRCQIQQYP